MQMDILILFPHYEFIYALLCEGYNTDQCGEDIFQMGVPLF